MTDGPTRDQHASFMPGTNYDQVAGCLYGGAFGDALGRPTEFLQLSAIHREYGSTGRMALSSPALVTDDTQMTLAVGEALLDCKNWTPKTVSAALRRHFVRWLRLEPARAPGVTCMMAVRLLEHDNTHWQDATRSRSKGCGANMRVAPAAFIGDTTAALGVAQLQAAITHGHPTALAAAELTALAIRLAPTTGPDDLPWFLLDHAQERLAASATYRSDWLGRLGERRWSTHSPAETERAMDVGWSECIEALDRTLAELRRPSRPEDDPCRNIGGGWIAEEALAVALYCAVRCADDPIGAISLGARTSGDSDSIASIAGQIVGSAHGLSAWPVDWVQQIEYSPRLEQLSDAVSERTR